MRSTDDALHRSYPALQATKGGSSRGNFPLDPVLLPFAGAKGRPRRRGVLARPCIRPTPPLGAYKFGPKILLLLSFIEKYPPPTGEMKLRHGFCRQSLRLISFATSLYTREAFASRRPPSRPKISFCTISTKFLSKEGTTHDETLPRWLLRYRRHRRGPRRHRSRPRRRPSGLPHHHLHHLAGCHRQYALQSQHRRHRQGPPCPGAAARWPRRPMPPCCKAGC